MKKLIIAAALGAVLLSAGCIREKEEARPARSDGQVCRVEFRLSSAASGPDGTSVKSTVGDGIMSDGAVSDINIMVYDAEGQLFSSIYSETASGLAADLFIGCDYEIFALANAGKVTPPQKKSALKDLRYEIQSISELSSAGSLPLCGSAAASPKTGAESVSIPVKRMVSEIVLDFVPEDGVQLDITSVECVNVPLDMLPFGASSVPLSRGGGDAATDSDLQSFMAGGQVRLYMLEDASSENDVHSSDENLSSQALPSDLPYINIKGSVTNSAGLLSAKVDYRLVLDWKLLRNYRYTVTFKATGTGIYEDSYRVEVTEAQLDIPQTSYSLAVGETAKIEVPVMEYADVSFTSDSPGTVTVDALGNICAVSAGAAHITVSCPSINASATCLVEVFNYDAFTDYTLSLSQYARTWGTLKFPSATEDNPVYVTVRGRTIAVGQGTPDGSDRVSVVSACHSVFYFPETSSTTLWICNGYTLGQTSLRVVQGEKAADISLSNASWPVYKIFMDSDPNTGNLPEAGNTVPYELYLADVNGNTLSASEFYLPLSIRKYYDDPYYNDCYEDFLGNLYITSEDNYGNFMRITRRQYGWEEDEHYLEAGEMNLTKADYSVPDSFILTYYNDVSSDMPVTDLQLSVNKTFKNQGYLGERYNYQLAAEDLYSDRMYFNLKVPSGAVWEIRKISPTADRSDLAALWESGTKEYATLMGSPVNNGGTDPEKLAYIPLYEPSLLDKDEFYATGSYILRGCVESTSGTNIYGYYTFDVVLYMRIISELVFVPSTENLNMTYVYRSFVPLTPVSMRKYQSFWSYFDAPSLYDRESGLVRTANGLQESRGTEMFSVPYASFDPQNNLSLTSNALSPYYTGTTGNFGDFDFIDCDGSRVNELIINSSNASDYGSPQTYWHFVRQYDVGGATLKNYILEMYYGDFDNY